MTENFIVGDKNCLLKITDILSQHDIFYTKWSDVFTRLNVPFETREPNRIALLNKSTTPKSVFHECLQVWRSRESTKATVGTLISALVQCDLTAIADELRDKFKKFPEDTSNVIIKSEECKIIATDFLKDDKGFESRWKDILRNLNVSTDIIDHKVMEFEKKDSKIKIEDVYTACLENWTSTEGERATAGRLISVLHQFELSELADELQVEYGVSLKDIQRPEEPLSPSATWASLDKERKELLIGRKVTFQKRLTNMQTIFKELGHSKKSLNTFMEKYLEENLLADLYYDRNPVIVRDTLPVKIRYYIERFFLSRRGISENIFKNSGDVFLVSGVERPVLSKLAGKEITDTSQRQAQQSSLTVRYILLELKSDFDGICRKTEKNVHWVEHHDGAYNWKRSKGDMGALQSNIAPEQKPIEENEFLQHLEKGSKAPICISDSPGMGKSVVLANMGRILQTEHPERLILFVPLNKFISLVKQVDDNLDIMQEVLLKMFCKTPFEYNLCKIYFQLKHLKVDILLDGLDEVSSEDSELALTCVKMLDSMPAVRVWVSTRPHHRNNLENTFQQFAYNIQAFSLKNQTRFLVRYWAEASNSDGVDLNEMKLETFAMACLAILKHTTRDADKWAGASLQCLLIAEVFRIHAVNFCDKNAGGENTLPYISISNLKELFDRLVEKKIELFAARYPEKLGELTPEVISQLENSHIVYALQVLLPDIKFEELQMTLPLPIDVLLKVGLIETSVDGQTPQFIHLTFAEYFVAKFVHQMIQQGMQFPVYMDIFFQTMNHYTGIFDYSFSIEPRSFKFPVVLYFLNFFLGPDNSTFSDSLCFDVNRMKDLLNTAICGNYLSLFCWFLKHPSARQVITSEHLFLAIGFGDVNLIQEVIKLFENKDILSLTLSKIEKYEYENMKEYEEEEEDSDSEEEDENEMSLLHVAAVRREYKVFEYLLKTEGFAEYLDVSKTTSNGLIHRCVRYTKWEEDDVIKARVHILTAILQLNLSILEEVWPVHSKKTPLLCWNIHVNLLQAMISNGANALAQSEDGDTVLHTAAKYLSRDEYDQLIHHIPPPTFKKIVHIVDHEYEHTPMMAMIENFEPLESSLTYFIQHDSDVNKKDKNGFTCVRWAVKNNRSVECVETLLRLGASGTNIDKNGGNLLHVAAEWNNAEVIKMASIWQKNMQQFEEDGINSKDSNDNTPLHRACSKKCTEISTFTVELLIKLGANVNSKNREGNTSLHEAAASLNKTPEIIKILLDKNADHTVTNLKLDTPLLHGLQTYEMHLEKIQMLLSKEKQVCQKTATLALFNILTQKYSIQMTKEEYFELVELCLARGANINFVNEDKYSNFDLAIRRRCFLGIKFLMEKDCGLNIYDIIRRDPNIYRCAKRQFDQVPSLKYHCKCGNYKRDNCKLIWEELNKYPNLLRIPPSQTQI